MTGEILKTADVDRLITMADAVGAFEEMFRDHAEGALDAPPRHTFDSDNGSLHFTYGANDRAGLIGSRISGKFPRSSGEGADFDVHTPVKTDLVVAFDADTGELEGIVEGNRLPDMRTGAIGGVAIDHMARPDVNALGILGTGRQARTQLEAATAVRDFSDIRAYSRSRENRESYVAEMHERFGIDVESVESAEAAVRGVDVLACATASQRPVFEPEWLDEGAHVNTVGPMWTDAHELPFEVVERSETIVTDSLAQIEDYGDRFFLAGTDHFDRTVELGAVVTGQAEGRKSRDGLTLCCPMGIAGSEVTLAREVFEAAGSESGG